MNRKNETIKLLAIFLFAITLLVVLDQFSISLIEHNLAQPYLVDMVSPAQIIDSVNELERRYAILPYFYGSAFILLIVVMLFVFDLVTGKHNYSAGEKNGS